MAGKKSGAFENGFENLDGWEVISPKTDAKAWEKGTTVTGFYLGMEESTFENEDGSKAVICTFDDREEGAVAYWTPAILRNRLEGISSGTLVRVECLGKVRTRSGRSAWDFKVMKRA